jgi:hypothetical protein
VNTLNLRQYFQNKLRASYYCYFRRGAFSQK